MVFYGTLLQSFQKIPTWPAFARAACFSVQLETGVVVVLALGASEVASLSLQIVAEKVKRGLRDCETGEAGA